MTSRNESKPVKQQQVEVEKKPEPNIIDLFGLDDITEAGVQLKQNENQIDSSTSFFNNDNDLNGLSFSFLQPDNGFVDTSKPQNDNITKSCSNSNILGDLVIGDFNKPAEKATIDKNSILALYNKPSPSANNTQNTLGMQNHGLNMQQQQQQQSTNMQNSHYFQQSHPMNHPQMPQPYGYNVCYIQYKTKIFFWIYFF